MAGLSSSRGRLDPEPNMIPMIDVMLVLLIIFMLKGVRQVMPVQVPPVSTSQGSSTEPIVLELLPGMRYAINRLPVSDSLLETVLGQIYEGRPTKLLYVKASDDRSYQEVIQVFDRVRGAGVQVISLMPR
ncbi:MAG TPA: biopolymer transporter ExbD [Gemmatimonadales bacterium]|jgi:biopolymer transport protein ExbD|nr:biopolymer transporter ExbD [Gemmatimonadales bacterium]